MKLAVIGGSFNPIHIGHLALADSVICELGYDKVLFVPALKPPHKVISMKNAVSAADRLEMINLACTGNIRIEADSCELDRGGVSYTYDTICFLEEKYTDSMEGKIGFVLGQELAAEFHLWHRNEALAQKTDLILAKRYISPELYNGQYNEYSNDNLGSYTGISENIDLSTFPYPYKQLNNTVLPVSSTEIRVNIAENRSWRYLVPEEVFHYIVANNLYGYKKHNR